MFLFLTVFATSTLLTPADDLFEKYLKRRTDDEEPEDMADLFEEAKKHELTNKSKRDIIDIEIDEIVPCLKDAKTGETIPTEISIMKRNELKNLH